MSGRRIVILTGAGISAESGLGTFRDKDGLWTKVRLEDVATPEGFARDPDGCHAFYNARRGGMIAAQPNAAHLALARLEAGLAERGAGEVLIVTQNIDDLHEKAGSTNLIHMHGEMGKARCGHCEHVLPWAGDLSTALACGACGRSGGMRPHVVWFGEMPFDLERIAEALADCDLFVSIGTSGNVYPAAGFVSDVRRRGLARTLELNLEPSEGFSLFEERLYGPATEIVPAWVEALLEG